MCAIRAGSFVKSACMFGGFEQSADSLHPCLELRVRGAVDYVVIGSWILLLPLTDFEFCSVFVESHGVSEVADCVGWGLAEREHPGDKADLCR